MSGFDCTESLVLDLLEWLGSGARPSGEVLEAWRTSCPRLSVWEDANQRGYIDRHHVPGAGELISVSDLGAAHLRAQRATTLHA